MLGEARGLVAIDEFTEPREVIAVEPARPADREADAVQRQGRKRAERAMACPMDDPGIVVVGYGAAILLVSALGAVAGRRLLAW
jgi:hypothetical protein